MKKLILLSVIFFSCSKDKRTCQCSVTTTTQVTTTTPGPNGGPGTPYTTSQSSTYLDRVEFESVTKKQADYNCQNKNETIGTTSIAYSNCQVQ